MGSGFDELLVALDSEIVPSCDADFFQVHKDVSPWGGPNTRESGGMDSLGRRRTTAAPNRRRERTVSSMGTSRVQWASLERWRCTSQGYRAR